jgi:hypothetical protein
MYWSRRILENVRLKNVSKLSLRIPYHDICLPVLGLAASLGVVPEYQVGRLMRGDQYALILAADGVGSLSMGITTIASTSLEYLRWH